MFKRAVHPGAILQDELAELGVAPADFERQIQAVPGSIAELIAGHSSITGDTAIRFGHWFGVEPEFWLNLQAQYDLAVADAAIGAAVRHLPTAPVAGRRF